MSNVARIIDAHRFFCRKSQHFVLGNWSEYVPISRRKLLYWMQFPIAYCKFMCYTIADLRKAKP
jgi:hypothetical protein